jgi:hypothetical protein
VADDAAHAEILARLRARLRALAAAYDVELDEIHDAEGRTGPGTAFVLRPTAPGATYISVRPGSADSTFIQFGEEVVEEIFTSPEQVPQAVDDVMAVVAAIAAGRARQRFWFSAGDEVIAAEAWVQLDPGGRSVALQRWGHVPWPFHRGRYRFRDVRYAPYG